MTDLRRCLALLAVVGVVSIAIAAPLRLVLGDGPEAASQAGTAAVLSGTGCALVALVLGVVARSGALAAPLAAAGGFAVAFVSGAVLVVLRPSGTGQMPAALNAVLFVVFAWIGAALLGLLLRGVRRVFARPGC
jgi:hypothetical protein